MFLCQGASDCSKVTRCRILLRECVTAFRADRSVYVPRFGHGAMHCSLKMRRPSGFSRKVATKQTATIQKQDSLAQTWGDMHLAQTTEMMPREPHIHGVSRPCHELQYCICSEPGLTYNLFRTNVFKNYTQIGHLIGSKQAHAFFQSNRLVACFRWQEQADDDGQTSECLIYLQLSVQFFDPSRRTCWILLERDAAHDRPGILGVRPAVAMLNGRKVYFITFVHGIGAGL